MNWLIRNISVLYLLILFGCSVSNEKQMLEMQLHSAWEVKNAEIKSFQQTTIPSDIYFNQTKFQTYNPHLSWEFRTQFAVDKDLLSYENIDMELPIIGKVSVFLNDSLVFNGQIHTIPITIKCKKYLLTGSNTLRVLFKSQVKPEYGIWAPVKLRGWDMAKITHVNLYLASLNEKKAVYNVDISLESTADLDVNLDLWINNKKPVKLRDILLTKGNNKQTLSIIIPNPKLWWCNGLGTPNRNVIHTQLVVPDISSQEYATEFEIKKFNGNAGTDSSSGNCLRLNNQNVYIKGMVFNPPLGNCTDSTLKLFEHIIQTAVSANINYIFSSKPLFFGKDIFQDLCNRNGVLYSDEMHDLNHFQRKLNAITINNGLDPGTHLSKYPVIITPTDTLKKYYLLPADSNQIRYLEEIYLAEKIKTFIETDRIKNPSCGIVLQTINDTCINRTTTSYPNWSTCKTVMATLQDNFSNYLVIPSSDKNKTDIYIVNDEPRELTGILLCRLIDFYGKDYYVRQIPVSVPPASVIKAITLPRKDFFSQITENKACLLVQLNQPGQTVAQNLLYFVPPKMLSLPASEVKYHINVTSKNYNLIFKSNVLIKNVVLNTRKQNATFSDNQFDLLPGKRTKITVHYPGTQSQLESDLVIRYLNPSR